MGHAYQLPATQEHVFVADGPGGLAISGRTEPGSPLRLAGPRQLLAQPMRPTAKACCRHSSPTSADRL